MKGIREYGGIYLACGPTDLRAGVDGLAQMVRQGFKMDPFGNCIFLFCNRSRNRLKGLAWDRTGFAMYYKRLDSHGAKFVWPNNPEAVRGISAKQMEDLLNGLSVDPPRGFGEVAARDF